MRYIRVSALKEALEQLRKDYILVLNDCGNFAVQNTDGYYYGYIEMWNSELTPVGKDMPENRLHFVNSQE